MRLPSFDLIKYRPKTKKNSQKCAAENPLLKAQRNVAYKPQS
jgi:hypothetical protein